MQHFIKNEHSSLRYWWANIMIGDIAAFCGLMFIFLTPDVFLEFSRVIIVYLTIETLFETQVAVQRRHASDYWFIMMVAPMVTAVAILLMLIDKENLNIFIYSCSTLLVFRSFWGSLLSRRLTAYGEKGTLGRYLTLSAQMTFVMVFMVTYIVSGTILPCLFGLAFLFNGVYRIGTGVHMMRVFRSDEAYLKKIGEEDKDS